MTGANLGLGGGWDGEVTEHARAFKCTFFVVIFSFCVYDPRYMSQPASFTSRVFAAGYERRFFCGTSRHEGVQTRTSFVFASCRGPASFCRVGLGKAALWFSAATLDLLECGSMACLRCYIEHLGYDCVHIQYYRVAFQSKVRFTKQLVHGATCSLVHFTCLDSMPRGSKHQTSDSMDLGRPGRETSLGSLLHGGYLSYVRVDRIAQPSHALDNPRGPECLESKGSSLSWEITQMGRSSEGSDDNPGRFAPGCAQWNWKGSYVWITRLDGMLCPHKA